MNNSLLIKYFNKKKYFIFDFDGVIVNSNFIKAKNFYKIFNINDKNLQNKILDYHNFNIGLSRYDKINYYIENFAELTKFKNNKEYLYKYFKELCIEKISVCDEIPGVIKFIKKLKKNCSKIILCSATPINELNEILKKRNIINLFDKVYGYPDNKVNVLKNLLLSKSKKEKDFVYFGDSDNDYLAAKKNNIDFIHVKSNENFTINNKGIITINDFIL
tara:strand:+ start:15121 stop:15774 length:654 start_codon:yes stop_codon:yes gene_type:complete